MGLIRDAILLAIALQFYSAQACVPGRTREGKEPNSAREDLGRFEEGGVPYSFPLRTLVFPLFLSFGRLPRRLIPLIRHFIIWLVFVGDITRALIG